MSVILLSDKYFKLGSKFINATQSYQNLRIVVVLASPALKTYPVVF